MQDNMSDKIVTFQESDFFHIESLSVFDKMKYKTNWKYKISGEILIEYLIKYDRMINGLFF